MTLEEAENLLVNDMPNSTKTATIKRLALKLHSQVEAYRSRMSPQEWEEKKMDVVSDLEHQILLNS